MAARPTTPVTLAAAIAAATISLTGCSSSTSHDTSSGTNTATASHASGTTITPGEPVQTAVTKAAATLVPGPDGTQLRLFSSAPAATFTADNDTTYTAPNGYKLVAFGWNKAEGTDPHSGDDFLADYSKHADFQVVADGKTTTLGTVKGQDLSGTGGWVTTVPADAKNVKVQLATDDGKQVVEAGSTKRDNTASSGLDLTADMAAPVTSATKCDDGSAPTTGLPAGVTLTGSVACTVEQWRLSSHTDKLGWAPPGQAWVTLRVSVKAPQAAFGDTDYTLLKTVNVTSATLDGTAPRSITRPPSQPLGQAPVDITFPISATTKPQKLTLNVTWTTEPVLAATPDAPKSITITAPATLTGQDARASITQKTTTR